jgi:phosphohistidine phosphatase
MRLYFLRHGRAAEPRDWPGDDFARPLTPQGREELRDVAKGLRRLNLRLDAILTSPVARARETAEIVAAELGLAAEQTPLLALGCGMSELTALVMAHQQDHNVMLVGHEPDLMLMIGRLIAANTRAHVTLAKGACCRVDLPAPESSAQKLAGTGDLVWLLRAAHLARIGR